MKDLSRLGWTFLGAMFGLGAGFAGYLGIIQLGGERLQEAMSMSGFLAVGMVGGLCIGGMLGGGALVLWVLSHHEKKKRKKYFEEKKARRKSSKK
jgi:hypothetical protein